VIAARSSLGAPRTEQRAAACAIAALGAQELGTNTHD